MFIKTVKITKYLHKTQIKINIELKQFNQTTKVINVNSILIDVDFIHFHL